VAVLVVLGPLGTAAFSHDDARPPGVQDKTKTAASGGGAAKQNKPNPTPAKRGLLLNDPKALQGYTLLAPLDSTNTYLLDMQGKVVQTWASDSTPALFPMLLENGHLLRPGSIGSDSRIFGPQPGVGGRIQEFTWEGKLVWDYRFYNARQLPHHDMTRLPNGNVLLIVSDRKTTEEALAAGRRPELIGNSYLIPDSLVEIKPTGPTTGEVVWEWHLWDHLVQDHDKTKANYGNVREHPELVNLNYTDGEPDAPAKTPRPQRTNPDWTHFNGVAYNPDLDQIAVSVHAFSEFWILDHGTTTAQAAGHKGGRGGKGGDLLYRWGNPRTYRAGTKADQKLFRQHNAHWIPKGHPGEGHLLVFNNGNGRTGGNYSSVDELALPVDAEGRYACKPGTAYGPDQPFWSYSAPKKSEFYSSFISGAQRLPNGNTLICSGANGTVFEVTADKEIVWKYVNPGKGGPAVRPPAPPGQILSPVAGELLGVSAGQRTRLDALQKDIYARLDKLFTADQKKRLAERGRNPGPLVRPGQVLPVPEQVQLKLTDEQKKDLAALQLVVDEQFAKVLTLAQRKQLKSVFAPVGPPPPGPPPAVPAPGGAAHPGKIFSAAQQAALKLSPGQKQRLEEIQKEIDARLATVLTGDQQKQLQKMQQQGPAVVPGVPPPAGGPPLFRARRYPTNYPAFAGRKLSPGIGLEELPPGGQKKTNPTDAAAKESPPPVSSTSPTLDGSIRSHRPPHK
jgi:hypothetical protein